MSCRHAVISLWNEAIRLITGIRMSPIWLRMVRMPHHASSLSSMRYRTSPTVQVVRRDLGSCSVAAFLDRQALLFDGMAGHFATFDRQRFRPFDLAAFIG